MKNIKHEIAKIPVIGYILLFLYKINILFKCKTKSIKNIFRWLFKSREITNFTYGLTSLNKSYLAALISNITNKDYRQIADYISEIESDHDLLNHVKQSTRNSRDSYMADEDAKFAKRMGWYAFVRAMKPKVVVETGVDKGLGSCVITAAIKKNKEEGFDGYYYGTDINPKAGYLLSGEYSKYGEILYGDSIESLKKLDKTVDIFINDSDHSAAYEALEYETIKDKLTKDSIILGDNSHVTDKLLNFSNANGMKFIFFKEEPLNHWYPGAGIGVAYFHK